MSTKERLRAKLDAERNSRQFGQNVSGETNYEPATKGDKVPGFRKQREYGAKMRIKP